MPSPYLEAHWRVLSTLGPEDQGTVGSVPIAWAKRVAGDVPDFDSLPSHALDRKEVRAICTDRSRSVLFGYVCAMAWGGQGGGVTQRSAKQAWHGRVRLEQHLKQLRKGGFTRNAAYDLFCGGGEIRGLGPSFFTKLLYFFSPEPSFYIMDQWTAKSINLLTGKRIVKLLDTSPTRENTGGEYNSFCEEVDAIAALIGCTGCEAEERLFSRGGRKPGAWRKHVAEATARTRANTPG
jgi:8-oxoguanine DNA glycosylase-like protein